MRNPWTSLPLLQEYVLPGDRPYVDAWNDGPAAEDETIRLHTDAIPEPFVGPHDAPVVVLGRNPGWREGLPRDRDYDDVVWGNLGDDPAGYVHPGFLERFEERSGGWWVRRWKNVVRETDLSFEDLARRVLAVEWHGYYSARFAALTVTLPSQWYGFDLVDRALKRGALIVVTKGLRDWEVAVPSLRGYSRTVRTHSDQAAYISQENLGSDEFHDVTEALRE